MSRHIRIVLALVLLAAACTPSEAETTTTSSPTTTVPTTTTTPDPPDGLGGEVAIGVDLPILTLNPFSEDMVGSANLAGQAVWATIYDIDPDTWERTPDTVTSLPSRTPGAIEVSDDGSMTVRYEVRRGAMWSDGTPITGADIEFTAVAMFQLALAGVSGVDPVMRTVTDTDSVERIAWITFSAPTLAFEDALWVILPSHSIEQATDVRFADGFDWPAGGPFMAAADQDSGTLVLDRNPHYWKTDDQDRQLPYLDSLRFVFADEPGDEVALFTGREVDVIVVPPSPDARAAVAEDGAKGAVIDEMPIPILEHLTFQFSDSRFVANPDSANDLLDYRKAVALTIDRPGLVTGTGVPWSQSTPSILNPLGGTIWSVYDYDPDAAGDLIDQMYGPDEAAVPPRAVLSTTGNGDYRNRIGDALVDSFQQAGITLETAYLDSLIFFGDALGSGEFDIGMWAWVSDGGYANQLQLLEILDPESDTAGTNFGNWEGMESVDADTSTFSALVAEARTTTDAARFAEITARAEELLMESLPLIPLFRRSSTAAHWPDRVSNISHNGSESGLTWNVEEWRRDGS